MLKDDKDDQSYKTTHVKNSKDWDSAWGKKKMWEDTLLVLKSGMMTWQR